MRGARRDGLVSPNVVRNWLPDWSKANRRGPRGGSYGRGCQGRSRWAGPRALAVTRGPPFGLTMEVLGDTVHAMSQPYESGIPRFGNESASLIERRGRFIARTYNHLFGAIVAFTLIEMGLFASGAAESIARAMLGASWLLVLGAFMIVSWAASHLPVRLRRSRCDTSGCSRTSSPRP